MQLQLLAALLFRTPNMDPKGLIDQVLELGP